MNVSYLDGLILDFLEKIKGQRTIYSPLHILNGKKSSQPIQDTHMFGFTPYFGLLPKLDRKQWEKVVLYLNNLELINETEPHTYVCTEKGKVYLREWRNTYPAFRFLDGWAFKNQGRSFWKRLHLIVQTVSCLMHGNRTFIPVQRDYQQQQFVKQFIKSSSVQSIADLGMLLYQELREAFKEYGKLGPDLMVAVFTSNHRAGLTIDQAAKKYGLDSVYAQCLFWDIVHFLMRPVDTRPLLSQLTLTTEGHPLTGSTKKTLEMLRSGYTKDEVADLRKLKVNTIEDHIVEIVTCIPDFPIDSYMNDEEAERIKAVMNKEKSNQLRHIRSLVGTEISYFKIRLMMARYRTERGMDEWSSLNKP